ncbi:hypothetical protein CLU79DRAFT_738720 [Phycomyces nitens]|nr:hypothetical protein CLU79DRAFT_738720 [Phycomyces nitens]
MISTGLGLTMASLGIIGLALALLSLIPVNVYNIVVAVSALKDLVKYEYDQNRPEWWLLPKESALYLAFLTGSVISSLITMAMVMVTLAGGKRQAQKGRTQASGTPHPDLVSQDNLYKRHGRTDIESSQVRQPIQGQSSVWLGRIGCLVFVGQIGWALFGTHVLFFTDPSKLFPATVRTLASISVFILWLNYIIIAIFSFILFCASFFIILGGARRRSQHQNGGEMQAHHQETTPLLR